ncbi:ROK family protein [Actinomadura sp. ATCC 31491]|uniref:ROK family protein n=1 Tax=Actinomadura luzonensis TaxID=2805427 RepID=A0ABT0FZB8_9ACTN|nr:ROK family protein [Actinomadura luzonensis]MCK2217684.1 ROK family protein [Actinomadura luzonensis]
MSSTSSSPASRSSFVVALDVGGTSMKGGLVSDSGKVLLSERRPTPRTEGGEAVVAAVSDFISHLAAAGDGEPAGVGLAVPGLVSEHAAIYATNLGWRDVPASAFTTLDIPVMLGHDVRTGGLAESILGAGRGVSDFLFLPIGTGIAGASIIRGEPYGGSSGWAGEIGHTPVFPDGEQCACGQFGCLETYASAASVGRRYSRRAGVEGVKAEQVVTSDDPIAIEIWDEAVEALSLALATYTLLLDPSVIVLGGGLAEAGPALFDPVRTRLVKRLAFRDAPPLVPAALGVDAGMLGAALLGWRAAGRPELGPGWEVDVRSVPLVS